MRLNTIVIFVFVLIMCFSADLDFLTVRWWVFVLSAGGFGICMQIKGEDDANENC